MFYLLGFLVFLFDRLFKFIVINVSENSETFLIPKILSLQLYKNYGTAFGLNIPIFVIIILSVLILFLMIFFLKKKSKNIIPNWVLLFLILGSFSNIFDRIYYGFVIDAFNFLNTSFFNIADGMILFSLIMIFYYYRKIY